MSERKREDGFKWGWFETATEKVRGKIGGGGGREGLFNFEKKKKKKKKK